MSAKILEFRPKTNTHPVREMILQEQAEIVCANDALVNLNMSSDLKCVLKSLTEVLELNTNYLYEKFSFDHQETQALLLSYTRILAKLRLMIS